MQSVYFPLLPKPLPRRMKQIIWNCKSLGIEYHAELLNEENRNSFNDWLDSITIDNYETINNYEIDVSNTSAGDMGYDNIIFFADVIIGAKDDTNIGVYDENGMPTNITEYYYKYLVVRTTDDIYEGDVFKFEFEDEFVRENNNFV